MAPSVYPAPNIMKELKSRKMIWVVHVTPVGGMQDTYKLWWGNLKKRQTGTSRTREE